MKFIKNLGRRLGFAQKVIIATAVPLVLFVIAFVIADEANYGRVFDLDDTGLIWIIFIVIVGYFEYNLYSDKE